MAASRHPSRAAHHKRILSLYTGAGGWVPAERGVRLTPESASDLMERGFSMARVRDGWRGSRQVSLCQYLQVFVPTASDDPPLRRRSNP